jgi:hypothetical protein
MADINEVYALLQVVADALGAGEGTGTGYGDSDSDGSSDAYGTYGQGATFSLYSEVLKLQKLVAQNLDVPVSSREPALKEPGPGNYVIGRVVKDDTEQHMPIYNALVEARYSGTSNIIRSTRTNVDGKFVLFFTSNSPMDVYITSDAYQGIVLYGVIPQQY